MGLALHRWNTPTSLQRRARPGRGANKAQAPAVDGLAAQRRYERACKAHIERRVRFWLAKRV